MINKTFKLIDGRNATLTTYILDDGEYARKGLRRPAVVICPGGGYQYCSKNEGEPVAIFFNRHGYNAFVLEYSVTIAHPFPEALQELASAMALVRKHKDEWLISDELDVIGFSAGGNLALSLGCFYKEDYVTKELGLNESEIRPDKIILGYPTVTLKSKRPAGTCPPEIEALMDQGLIPDLRGTDVAETMAGHGNLTDEDYERLSLLNHLHSDMPSTFIFGSYEDSIIPSNDYLDLAKGLVSLEIPTELHFYSNGPHGVSLCDRTVQDEWVEKLNMNHWTNDMINWLKTVK